MKKQLPIWIKYYKALLKFFNSALKEEELSMKMGELKNKLIRRLHKNPFVFKADEYGIIEWYIRSSKDDIKIIDEIEGIEDVIQNEKDINIVIKDILKPEAQDIETPEEAERVMDVVNEIMNLSNIDLIVLNEVWDSKKDVPNSLKKLSLNQANYWAKVYDALKDEGKDESSAAKIAWMQTKKKYSLKF